MLVSTAALLPIAALGFTCPALGHNKSKWTNPSSKRASSSRTGVTSMAANAAIAESYPVPDKWLDRPASNLGSLEEYKKKYKESVENPAKFWGTIASESPGEAGSDGAAATGYGVLLRLG